MNIIQVEDNLKSIPDDRLQQEMSNPSGMFPQYLVMSEIQRRTKMREDYEGRMAANEKTPPRPTMREEMMMSMQPTNMPSGGIADIVSSQSLSSNPVMPPMAQEPVRMNEGGVLKMAPGGMLDFNDPFTQLSASVYGFRQPEDDPTTPDIDESLGAPIFEKSDAQKQLEEYRQLQAKLMPERLEKQRKLMGGLNLLQSGIAIATSATPEQIGANMNRLIDSIGKTEDALQKQEDKITKAQIDGLVADVALDKAQKEGLLKTMGEQERRRIEERRVAAYETQAGKPLEFERLKQDALDAVPLDTNRKLPIYQENENGQILYTDPDGNETTNPTTIIEKDGIPREVQNEPRIDRLRLDNYARLSISSVAGARAREFGDIVGGQDDSVSARFFLKIENPELSSEEIDAKLAQMNADEIREKARIYNQITQVQTQNRAVGGVVGDAEKSFYSAVESM
jgi:hypothetical protein